MPWQKFPNPWQNFAKYSRKSLEKVVLNPPKSHVLQLQDVCPSFAGHMSFICGTCVLHMKDETFPWISDDFCSDLQQLLFLFPTIPTNPTIPTVAQSGYNWSDCREDFWEDFFLKVCGATETGVSVVTSVAIVSVVSIVAFVSFVTKWS